MSLLFAIAITSNPELTAKEFCKIDASASEENGLGAKQEFRDDCDINHILKSYKKTGVLQTLNGKTPMFEDVEAIDLQEAMNITIEAEKTFMQLPAILRKEFDHSPLEFLKAAQQQEKHPVLEKHGMYKPEKQKPKPQEVVVVSNNNDDKTTTKNDTKPAS